MFKEKIKKFWFQHESRIIIFLSLILVAGAAFQVGVLRAGSWERVPLIIEKPVVAASVSGTGGVLSETQKETLHEHTSQNQESRFIGSKNSNKYHLPDCRFAKKIKEENLVYFTSAEDAKAKGYEAGSCVKE